MFYQVYKEINVQTFCYKILVFFRELLITYFWLIKETLVAEDNKLEISFFFQGK